MIEFNKDHFTASELIEYLQTLDPEQELTISGDIFQEGYLTEYIPPSPPSGKAPEGTLGRIVQEIYGPMLAKQLSQETAMLKRVATFNQVSDKYVTFPVHNDDEVFVWDGKGSLSIMMEHSHVHDTEGHCLKRRKGEPCAN